MGLRELDAYVRRCEAQRADLLEMLRLGCYTGGWTFEGASARVQSIDKQISREGETGRRGVDLPADDFSWAVR